MRIQIIILTCLTFLFCSLSVFARTHKNNRINIPKEISVFHKATLLNTKILKLAFEAYNCAMSEGYGHHPGIFTIVDYQLPSGRKRLWVLDLKHNRVLFNTYVTHGSGSGDIQPTYFSDYPNSYASSLGLYITGRDYVGEWGYALRLHGLDNGFNDEAYSRAIVLHSGNYVSATIAHRYGMVGLSHGCFVIPTVFDHRIIHILRGGTLLFAYYPESDWLQESQFLHCGTIPKPFKYQNDRQWI